MSFEYLSDQSIIRYYEEIRKLADDDRQAKRRFTDRPSIRQRAETLRAEITRRKLKHPAHQMARLARAHQARFN